MAEVAPAPNADAATVDPELPGPFLFAGSELNPFLEDARERFR